MLLIETAIPFTATEVTYCNELTEDVEVKGIGKFKPIMNVKGIFQRYDCVNSNNRFYSKKVFEKALNDEKWKQSISDRTAFGQIEHPNSGATNLKEVSHIITKAYDNGDGTIMGEAVILNNANGIQLASLFAAGSKVGISSRGDGEVEIRESVQHVKPESFRLITWDLVGDPSVVTAKVEPLENESKELPKLKEAGEKIGTPPIQEKKMYISTASGSTKTSYMSKISEMRKLGVELHRVTETNLKKAKFQDKVALSEQVMELRGQIHEILESDAATKGYGLKLLKEADEFDDRIEQSSGGEAPAPPVDDAPPTDEFSDEEGGEEEVPKVSKEQFDEIARPAFTAIDPEAMENEELMAQLLDAAFGAYETGDTELDFSAICDQVKGGGEEGEDEFNGDDEFSPGEEKFADEDKGGEPMPVGQQFEHAVKLAARLKSSATKGEEFRAALTEAQGKIEELSKKLEESNDSRSQRSRAILVQARDEIINLTNELKKSKDMNEACVEVMVAKGITDVNELIEKVLTENAKKAEEEEAKKLAEAAELELTEEEKKEFDALEEGDKAAFLKMIAAKKKGKKDSGETIKGEEAKDKKKAEADGEEGDGKEDKNKTVKSEAKEEPKTEPVVESKKEEPKTDPKTEPKKEEPKTEPVLESKEDEPDFLRQVKRNRTNAFRQM